MIGNRYVITNPYRHIENEIVIKCGKEKRRERRKKKRKNK